MDFIIMREFVDRRKHKRYKAIDGIITMLGFPSNIMGSILDLSKGGLSFQYIVDAERPYESKILDILYTEKLIYIDKVPFKAVFDIDLSDQSSSMLFPLRRCGVQFGALTQDQEFQLELLIRNYTKKNSIAMHEG